MILLSVAIAVICMDNINDKACATGYCVMLLFLSPCLLCSTYSAPVSAILVVFSHAHVYALFHSIYFTGIDCLPLAPSHLLVFPRFSCEASRSNLHSLPVTLHLLHCFYIISIHGASIFFLFCISFCPGASRYLLKNTQYRRD